jgi:hypothetical protein
MSLRFLHVANGSATTQLIEAAGIPGRRSTWADVLYDGPVPGGLSDAELLRVRARHLSRPGEAAYLEEVRGLQRWREEIEAASSYDELVLWYEHDLFDQLNLLQLFSWLKGRLPAANIVSLIEIGRFPGRAAFKGLGELSPGDLVSLLETRVPVSAERYVQSALAWTAFRQATPEALDDLSRGDTSSIPFLRASLKRFLEEYPWTRNGLSRSERRLLEIASSGPVDLWTMFLLMHEGETAYYITDLSLLSLLREFSRLEPPLISVAGASLDADRIPTGTVTITERGHEIVEGKLDRVATYGIDRWFGGVHLTGKTPAWRWDDARQRMVNQSLGA